PLSRSACCLASLSSCCAWRFASSAAERAASAASSARRLASARAWVASSTSPSGRRARLSGPVRSPPRSRQALGRALDKLLGPPLGLLGLALGLGDLVPDLFRDFLALLFGVRLSGLAFAPDELLGRLLGFRDSLFYLEIRFAVDLAAAGAATRG